MPIFYLKWIAMISSFAIFPNVMSTINCTAGTYASTAAATNCTSCATGKYSTKVGATVQSTCVLCGSGKYISTVGSTSCTLCGIGKYSSINGASNCTTCVPGIYGERYAEYEGAYSCRYTCQVMFSMYQSHVVNGYYPCSKPDSFDPLECLDCVCLAGSYYTMYSDEFYVWEGCFYCDKGKYSSVSRASSCGLCEAGKFNPVTGASTCTPCAAGNYSLLNATLNCMSCMPGKYSTTVGASLASACIPCAPGTYSATVGASICVSCTTGKFSSSVGVSASSTCEACPAGSSSNAVGSSTSVNCTACKPGTYASEAGASQCTSCEAGKYSSASNTINCSQCGANPVCNPSEYLSVCSTTAQPVCARCNDATKPLYSSWLWSAGVLYTCIWICDFGFFKNKNNTCQACKTLSSCTSSQYVTACNSTADGACLNCFNKPLNSIYTAASVLYGISDCTWRCDGGYRLNANLMTCEPCAAGTYAADSPDACLPCQAGTFSSSALASACFICSNNTYTPALGATACTPCPVCTQTGRYREACKGTSAGLCSTCSNTIN